MSEQTKAINDALLALQAALLGRRVYDAAHPSLREQLTRAAQGLKAALRDQNQRRVLHVEDRVVVDNHRLDGSEQLHQGLFAELAKHGIDALCFSPGVTEAELHDLVTRLHAGDSPPDSTPHITVGTIAGLRDADAEPDRGRRILRNPDAARAQAESFGGVWTGLATQRRLDRPALEDTVDNITAAVTVGGDALLPMAELKQHSEYTFMHAVNVGILAAGLARAVGLSGQVLRDVTIGALLHDVGKQAVPVELLEKTGKLEEHELRIMRRHPTDGARILFDTPGIPDLVPIIAFEHHLHLDGTGYPHVRPGYTTHVASQIVQLADVYDALRTHRPYRGALPLPEVRETMGEGRGTRYDTELYDAFFHGVVAQTTRDAGETVADARAA